jgi:CheY-like chemotaxis protein
VADDNRDAADSLQRILSLYGYDVQVAYDGTAALKLDQRFAARVAVLDIGMPGANGFEVARCIRQSRGQDITLIALTGWGQEGDRRRAIEAGFDYHLTKPVDPGALNDLLVEVASK